MRIIASLVVVTGGYVSAYDSQPVPTPDYDVIYKPDYHTLDIICKDHKCHWSIPFPPNYVAKMIELSTEELKTKVTSAIEGADKSMLVNISKRPYSKRAKDDPFGGVFKKERDSKFGPALVKKFADYDIITCQAAANAGTGKNGRVLVTYAVKSKGMKAGQRLTTKSKFWSLGYESKRMTVFAAKFAHLLVGNFEHMTDRDNETVPQRTAKKFCYSLTNTAKAIYKEFGMQTGEEHFDSFLYDFETLDPSGLA
jgi:hypothetical protein